MQSWYAFTCRQVGWSAGIQLFRFLLYHPWGLTSLSQSKMAAGAPTIKPMFQAAGWRGG